jgi:chitin synthase
VIDSTVPTKLLNLCALKDGREFTHIRCSAATGDPNDFKDNGFTLRQVHYDPPRRTELFIVVTMYNEDDSLFTRTMHGVMKNIAYLCKRDRSKTWGKDAWKKVVVCIVSDGRQEINSRTLSVMATIGAYQDGIATYGSINSKPVVAHIYEYTTQSTFDRHLVSQLSHALCSIRYPIEGYRRRGERYCPRADHLLLEGETPGQDQFSPLVLQRVWTHSST